MPWFCEHGGRRECRGGHAGLSICLLFRVSAGRKTSCVKRLLRSSPHLQQDREVFAAVAVPGTAPSTQVHVDGVWALRDHELPAASSD